MIDLKCEAHVRSFMTLGPGYGVCGQLATKRVFGKTKEEKKQPPMLLCGTCFGFFIKRNPEYKFEEIGDSK